MPEEKPAGVVGAVGGWVKAFLTSVVGLVSGAVIMYLTPLVNNAIKPPKPVANFAAQVSGLTVNFNNRSTGGTQGWWDFGDGSALEPFDPKTSIIKHDYSKSGTYSVKLSLFNILGDENTRTVSVTLEPDGGPRPEILAFELKSRTPGDRAPAVYHLKASVKGATHCILSVADDRPIEVLYDTANLDRYITFHDMGSYTVRLAAVNGKQIIEKSETIFIAPNNSNDPMAKLLVTYQAAHVQRYRKDMRIHCGWQSDLKDASSSFRKERMADPGCTFVSAELINDLATAETVRNPSVAISPDKKKLIVTGELIRNTGILAAQTTAPAWLAEVKVQMERRSPPTTLSKGDVSMMVPLGKPTLIPLPPLDEGWEVLKRDVRLELWEGSRKAWEGSKAVNGAKVTLKNQICFVTAAPQSDGYALRIDAPGTPTAPAPTTPITVGPPPVTSSSTPPSVGPIRKVGFEVNPFLPKKK